MTPRKVEYNDFSFFALLIVQSGQHSMEGYVEVSLVKRSLQRGYMPFMVAHEHDLSPRDAFFNMLLNNFIGSACIDRVLQRGTIGLWKHGACFAIYLNVRAAA